MRKIAAGFLRLLIRWLDDSVPEQKLRDYLKAHANEIEVLPTPRIYSNDEILDWIESIQKDRTRIWRDMSSRQREMILQLDQSGTRVQKEKLPEVMEHLLRHVEVKRQKSFITKGIRIDQAWEKRHQTSLLFCEYSARHNDLRFLNASFKMNDWGYRRYRCMGRSQMKSLFLLALKVQEDTVKGFGL